MKLALLKALNKHRQARRACILVTDTKSGDQWLYDKENLPDDNDLRQDIETRFYSGKSGGFKDLFVATYLPEPRLVIIGAVHISQHMVQPAKAAGFDVSVIDPRTAFASVDRFPNVPLHAEWPDEILATQPLDEYTALTALTHDPKIDDLPLIAALKAQCFYVGALGSRKTHAKRVARLKGAGLESAQIELIDAPIGLDIGAQTPAEIAVAVLGNIIAARRGKR